MVDEKTQSKPPYLAFKTFINFIDGLRTSGLPARIDRSVMGSQSGSGQAAILHTFKFLKLIKDDGTPTPALVDLVKTPATEAKKLYGELVKQHYAFVLQKGVDLANSTQSQLDDVFRDAGLMGDTVRKAVTFLVLLASESGMPVSTHLKSAKRKPSNGGGAPRKRKVDSNGTGDKGGSNPPANSGSGSTFTAPPPSMQEMLLAKFPSFNPKWDSDMQKKWFDSFAEFMAMNKPKP